MTDFSIVANIVANAKEFTKGIGEANDALDSLGASTSEQLGAIGGMMTGLGAGITASITAPVVAGVTASIKSFGDLEQAIGGIETMFGKDTAPKMIENANNAFINAGISATDYMEQVTSFSASLLQSVGGDTERAARSADQAINDMADNANKFGTNIADIQNAYQGFAKENYTMLDNLKLGYGGTKKEMQRLLKDAEALSGIEYDIESLEDVYEAIHVIQEEMGVTGTTALEATETINGSFNTMKAAFSNLVSGLANPEANIEQLLKNLSDSVGHFVKNIKRALKNIWDNLPISPFKKWALLISAISGPVLLAFGGIFNTLAKGPDIINGIKTAFTALTGPVGLSIVAIAAFVALFAYLYKNNPKFQKAVTQTWEKVKTGVSQAVTTVSKAIKGVWGKAVEWWNNNSEGILSTTTKVWGTIESVVSSAISYTSEIIMTIWGSLTNWWSANGDRMTSIAQRVWNAIKRTVSVAINIASDLIMTVWGAIATWWNDNQELILSTVETVWNGVLAVIDWVMTNIVPIVVSGWNVVVNVIQETWNLIKPVVEAGINFVLAIITSVMQIIQGDWQGAWETIKGAVGDVWESIKSLVINSIQNVSTTIANTIETIKANWDAFWNNLGNALNNVWETIKATVSRGIKGIDTVISDTVTAIQTGWNDFWTTFKESGIGEAWGRITELVTEGITGAQAKIDEILAQIKTAWDGFWNGLGDVVTSMWTNLEQTIGKIGEGIAGAFETAKGWFTKAEEDTEAVKQATATAQETITTNAEKSSTTVGEMATKVGEQLDNTDLAITTFLADISSAMLSGTQIMVNNFMAGLSRLPIIAQHITQQTTAVFRRLVNEMESLGRYAGQGFANGLSSSQSRIMSTAQSIADSVSRTIQKALDIHSPSRLFAWMGRMSIQGLVDGMLAMKRQAMNASKLIAKSVIPNLSGVGFSGNITHTLSQNNHQNGLMHDLLNAMNKNTSIYLDGRVLVGETRQYTSQALAEEGNLGGRTSFYR